MEKYDNDVSSDDGVISSAGKSKTKISMTNKS